VIEKGGVEAKKAVRALLDRLPDDCSVADVLYHLYILHAVERGQADVDAGRTISHEEVDKALRKKWLRGGGGPNIN
jgi:predicted transcriptional regulator